MILWKMLTTEVFTSVNKIIYRKSSQSYKELKTHLASLSPGDTSIT